MSKTPWVEKYRPNMFENILFNENNYTILKNMLETNSINNLLFVGPPGVGKTTTIINFINKYSKLYYNNEKIDLIHLNASDDRGIDIIRNHIYIYINSNNFNNKKVKFVILDEIDCMTKQAQIALKTIIQNSDNNILFCLICNYISKIDDSLLKQIIQIKFYGINKDKINRYLNYILKTENIIKQDISLYNLIDYYNNDIRSMINYLQINYLYNSIDKIDSIDNIILTNVKNENLLKINLNKNLQLFKKKLYEYSYNYHEDVYYVLHNYIYYVINDIIINNTKIETDTDIKKLNTLINNVNLFLNKNNDIVNLINLMYNLIKNYIKEN